jgi:23S rRNA (adenine2503-C2)-methyltransferase
MKRKSILGFEESDFLRLAESIGEKSFRGKQLYRQIYRRKEFDFEKMTDLAVSFRDRLKEKYEVPLPEVHQEFKSSDGTVKFLFRLTDGRFIEAVYIPEEGRDTLCISSQVGCNVGCTFCMTAQMGFQRNLRAGEIVGQVLAVIRQGYLADNGFNIVFMGMGEPLYNYQNVMKSFRILTDPEGMNLSHRKITVSTSGIVPVLRKLAMEPRIPNLAISLNSTENATRDRIMPINKKWPIEKLLDACREFPLEPRRRLTFEYVLLRGETDSREDALRLSKLLRGIPAKVNVIPYNRNPGLPHQSPTPKRIEEFLNWLTENNLSAFVRKTRGDDVSAACGQLAYLSGAQDEEENVRIDGK